MKLRIMTLLTAAALCLGLLSGCAAKDEGEASTSGTVTVTCIDVGKGDAILVQSGESAMLIDTGYNYSFTDIQQVLISKGVTSLDCLVITHYDKDHVGSASQVIENYEVSQVWLPDYEGTSKRYTAMVSALESTGTAWQRVSEDVSFELSGARVSILASDIEYVPEEGSDEGNDNDCSLVVTLNNSDDSYLFAGDLEKEGIKSFLSKSPGQYDVVKMPHHGDKNGKTDDLITALSPRIALITDSADEPAEDELLELLGAAGSEVYRTSQSGTVTIQSTGSADYQVSTEK